MPTYPLPAPRTTEQSIYDLLNSVIDPTNGYIRIDQSGIDLGGLTQRGDSVSLATGETIILPTAINGLLKVWLSDYSEHLTVFIKSDGTVDWAGNDGTGNTDIQNTLGKLCVYQSGTGAIIKNYLAVTHTVKYVITY